MAVELGCICDLSAAVSRPAVQHARDHSEMDAIALDDYGHRCRMPDVFGRRYRWRPTTREAGPKTSNSYRRVNYDGGTVAKQRS